MSVSVADFRRDRVTSWVYIRSRTSDSRRVSSLSTSYSAVNTWSVIVDNRMVRTDALSTRRSRSSAVDSSSSARHMIKDLIAERSMTERSWSSPSSGSRRYTLAASSTLEYGAQSCGMPIALLAAALPTAPHSRRRRPDLWRHQHHLTQHTVDETR